MARTTKKQVIYVITNILKEHPEKRVVVKHILKLRNGRFGLKPYVIFYDTDNLYISAWDDTKCNVRWVARLDKLTMAELRDIEGRCMMATHP